MEHRLNLPPEFLSQVCRNCSLASAGQAGHYSLCGVLLRLRQLYKWQHGLAPWQEPDSVAVLAWVEEEERLWEALEGAPFAPLAWGQDQFDPFAVEDLNKLLLPRDLAYGAGFNRHLAPTFFLGELAEVRHLEELTLLILGPEPARDLDGTPAMRQGNLIYVRKEALAFYLWDRLSDPMQQHNRFLKLALKAHGLSRGALLKDPEAYQDQFRALLNAEVEAALHHEIGEAREPSLKDAFSLILEHFPHTRIELWVRALKDALAEVNEQGRVQYLIREGQFASLALMLAWRPGLYNLLLPELEPAFWKFLDSGDWQVLEETRQVAYRRLADLAQDLEARLAAWGPPLPPHALKDMETLYLAPLGV